jgi:hypothetical protein
MSSTSKLMDLIKYTYTKYLLLEIFLVWQIINQMQENIISHPLQYTLVLVHSTMLSAGSVITSTDMMISELGRL